MMHAPIACLLLVSRAAFPSTDAPHPLIPEMAGTRTLRGAATLAASLTPAREVVLAGVTVEEITVSGKNLGVRYLVLHAGDHRFEVPRAAVPHLPRC